MGRLSAWAASGLLALTLGLAACGSQQAATDEPAAAPEEAAPEEAVPEEAAPEEAVDEEGQVETIVGGWTTNGDATPTVSDDERAIFERAIADSDGVGYEPVATVATQLVSGTNYSFLCKAATVTAESQASWSFVTVYDDLEGNASVTAIKPLDIGAPSVADDGAGSDLVGAWEIAEPADDVVLPDGAGDAFAAAMERYVGVRYRPYALIGTQVVAGTNYLYLCEGEVVAAEPVRGLYLVTVYQDLEGMAEVSDAAQLDLLSYVSE